MKIESTVVSQQKLESFPPLNLAWMGINDKGNIYLGKSTVNGHYYACIKGDEFGSIWTGIYLPKGIKPFYGEVNIKATL